jgi:hypothetical protein
MSKQINFYKVEKRNNIEMFERKKKMFACGNATTTYTAKSRIACFGYMHPATVSETLS